MKAFHDTKLIPVDESNSNTDPEGSIIEIDNSGQRYVFRSEILSNDTIPLIAALAAQDKGDARQAIKYLRKAGELADRNGDNEITASHAREAEALVEKEAVIEAMREMTTQAHLALAALTVLELADNTPVRMKPVYGVYKNIAKEIDADKLVQRRMKDHLFELDMQGIVDGEKVSAGSIGGPAWQFQLQVDSEIAVDVLQDISRLRNLDFTDISSRRVGR